MAVWCQQVQRCRRWSPVVGLVEPESTDSQAQTVHFRTEHCAYGEVLGGLGHCTRNTHAQSMPRAEGYPEICK